jgi:hypothetical protein
VSLRDYQQPPLAVGVASGGTILSRTDLNFCTLWHKRDLPYYTNPGLDLYRLRSEPGHRGHMLYGRLFLERIHRWMPGPLLGYWGMSDVLVGVDADLLHEKSVDLPRYRFAFSG